MATQLFDKRNMAHAQTKQKSVRIRLREGFLHGGHGDRIAGVDVRDKAGGDHHSIRTREEQARVRQNFAPRCFAEPKSSVTKLLQLASAFLCFRRRLIFKLPRPDSESDRLVSMSAP